MSDLRKKEIEGRMRYGTITNAMAADDQDADETNMGAQANNGGVGDPSVWTETECPKCEGVGWIGAHDDTKCPKCNGKGKYYKAPR